MREYQLVLILRPSLTEAKRKKLVETIKGWIKDLKVLKEEEWGQKVLSYPIKRENSGYYLMFGFECPMINSDFEKKLLAQEDVLRHLVIRRK